SGTRGALSRTATAGGARLDFREVGNLHEQPQGAVLLPDCCGPQAAGERNEQVEAIDGGDRADSRVREGLGYVLAETQDERLRRWQSPSAQTRWSLAP